MTKYTPGPWHDDGYRIYAPPTPEQISNADLEYKDDPRIGRILVEYKHVDNFNDGDGALIAAAPALYNLVLRVIYNLVGCVVFQDEGVYPTRGLSYHEVLDWAEKIDELLCEAMNGTH
tara:strand:+ start:1808 stop:2161 length:354 start_codon:yes stop_codon:yes gene_type:complete